MEMDGSKVIMPSSSSDDIVCLGTIVTRCETKLRLILLMLVLLTCSHICAGRMTITICSSTFLIHYACPLGGVLGYANLTTSIYILYYVRGLRSILHIWYLSWRLATPLSYSLNSCNYFIFLSISLWKNLLLLLLLLLICLLRNFLTQVSFLLNF